MLLISVTKLERQVKLLSRGHHTILLIYLNPSISSLTSAHHDPDYPFKCLLKRPLVRPHLDLHAISEPLVLLDHGPVALLEPLRIDLVRFLNILGTGGGRTKGVDQLVDFFMQGIHLLLQQPGLLVGSGVQHTGPQGGNPGVQLRVQLLSEGVDLAAGLLTYGLDIGSNILGVMRLLEHILQNILQLGIHLRPQLLQSLDVREAPIVPMHSNMLADALRAQQFYAVQAQVPDQLLRVHRAVVAGY